MFVCSDTAWFDADPARWFGEEAFSRFQALAGVDLHDLICADARRVERAQRHIAEQSKLFHEIRRSHTGFMMPFLYYTHDTRFAQDIPRWNPDLDAFLFASDLGDSLRRRHIALSRVLLPQAIRELHARFHRPLSVSNLGSGVGLDTTRAVLQEREKVGSVLNYELDGAAVGIGRQVVDWLESRDDLCEGQVAFRAESFTTATSPVELTVLAGIISGLTDAAAEQRVLRPIYERLVVGGRLVLTCANESMKQQDPLHSFLIQHIGTPEAPLTGWGLNYRSESGLRALLARVGFQDIAIFSDADYAGRATLGQDILEGVDPLPSMAFGHAVSATPIRLPSREVQQRRIGYNWIAMATK